MALTCPSCGAANPDSAKFCMECATSLARPARPVAEERKVVTSLFCDLVGFTATSETADPEDVRRMLASYFAMARTEIESYGGVVEKFIGDAVVGVFGIPAIHEDDAERAVHAGLRIVEAAESLTAVGGGPLRLRVGINTGEALVRLDVAPGSGEGFLTGDAINTASRLQSVAPEMGVAVGIGTYEASDAVFDYEELEPATLKGKSQPVRVFWAKSSRARFGTDLTRVHDTPFVGREIDLALMEGIFAKTLAATAPQIVTVVGEPGLGKSRIVAELAASVDRRPELITWRQGRCLPYGEGITFWALGEILKAHTGILESDDASTAADKLEVVLPPGREREWFRQRLRALLGIETTSSADHDELFTAWRRFFERIAEHGPTVLVFEDLHWADPALLRFIEHLADRAAGVPLLIVGTARPELFERHPTYTQGLRNTTTISLGPLSPEETARLVSGLLRTSVVPAELQAPILERAGGNPLYAEEFVRLLFDRDLLVPRGGSWELVEGAEVPFPDSVQALIAARLDTLAPERKSMLADAAVVGKVFWVGAVAAMSSAPEPDVAEVMHELSRKELVRSSRHSSMDGEIEYVFWHVLARDVAYAQIPRVSRASRHVAAAAWIESKAPDRLEDLADVLAYHYTAALELATASGESDQVTELHAPALRYLTLAGERALGLDNAAALDAFQRALALTAVGDPERAEALARFAEVALNSMRYAEAKDAAEEAVALFRARSDVRATARVMNTLARVSEYMNLQESAALNREALALLEPLPPGPELLDTLANVAFDLAVSGSHEESAAVAERAITIAAEAGLPRPVRALGFRAWARCSLGDAGGLDDFREALAIAAEAGRGREEITLYNNLGIELRNFEGPRAALEAFATGLALAEARGIQDAAQTLRGSELVAMLGAGQLDDLIASATTVAERAEGAGDELELIEVRSVLAVALTYRGDARQAEPSLGPLAAAVRRSGRLDLTASSLGAVAVVRAASGQTAMAAEFLREMEAAPTLTETSELAPTLPAIVRAAVAIGEVDLARRLIGRLPSRAPYLEHAIVAARAAVAEAEGELEIARAAYEDAASRWERFGVPPEEAFALLGLGRCLLELARADEAAEALRRSLDLFRGCGMPPGIEATGAALARATRLSS
jgi:class 3 adenylate cyclase/tetratricopeptide (TPR) repeat protein